MKDLKFEEPKMWTQKATFPYRPKSIESSGKAWKEMKKKWQREKRNKKDSALATGVTSFVRKLAKRMILAKSLVITVIKRDITQLNIQSL